MYSRILSFIGVALVFAGCTRPASRDQVEKDFAEMKSEVATQSLEQSWKTIDSFESKIKDFRASKPRQSEDDEIYMDRLMLGLKEIPRGSKLTDQQCANLEVKMIADFDPTSTPENRHPALVKVLEVVQSLCDKKE